MRIAKAIDHFADAGCALLAFGMGAFLVTGAALVVVEIVKAVSQ